MRDQISGKGQGRVWKVKGNEKYIRKQKTRTFTNEEETPGRVCSGQDIVEKV